MMLKRSKRNLFSWNRGIFYTLCIGVVCTGCFGGGEKLPELATVTGVVTLDGKPLKNVSVVFRPEAEGGASRGTTDDAGKFALMYNRDAAGAILGTHSVRFRILDADADANLIPKKYRGDKAGLPAEVTKDGPNEFTFDLTRK